jgi:signal transduction histidine kinase
MILLLLTIPLSGMQGAARTQEQVRMLVEKRKNLEQRLAVIKESGEDPIALTSELINVLRSLENKPIKMVIEAKKRYKDPVLETRKNRDRVRKKLF